MSVKNNFETYAGKISPERFDFQALVKEFYTNHPDKTNSIFFINFDPENKVAGLVRPVDDHKTVMDWMQSCSSIYDAMHYITDSGARAVAVQISTKDFGVILKNDLNDTSSETFKTFIFDHEVGHTLCPNGMGAESNFSECNADAYATLRHIQRFGLDDDFLCEQRTDRLMAFFCDPKQNVEHFTTPVTEQIVKDAADMDFDSLSPKDTVTLASRYAEKYALSTRRLQALQELSFMRFDEAEKDLLNFSKTVLNSLNPDVVRWGSAAMLSIFSDGYWEGDTKKKLPDTKKWQGIARALKDRAAKLDEQGGLLFGLKSQKSALKKSFRP